MGNTSATSLISGKYTEMLCLPFTTATWKTLHKNSRFIVGEVRGQEAVDMLQSINVGHSAMTTVHANSVRDVVSRLETMVLMGMEIPISAIRKQIASGFDYMIHLGRLKDGSRRVLEIAQPIGFVEGEVRIQTIFRFEQKGKNIEGRIQGDLRRVEKEKISSFYA